MIRVRLEVKEILGYLRRGENCKVEINSAGEAYVLPQEAAGYQDTILVQVFEAADLEDAGSEEDYKEWLASCYMEQLEAKNGEIVKIEII